MTNIREEASSQPENLPAIMAEKVDAAGGKMRFDAYMQEHLFGENGYYTSRAKIGNAIHYSLGYPTQGEGHFDTDASDPVFILLTRAYFKKHGLTGKDFLEIGGGDGTFKRNYLTLEPTTNYVSVDVSPTLAAQQEAVDEKPTHVTDGTKLPIPDSSINGIIFGNELLDALACRILKLEVSEEGVARVAEEGYVVNSDEGLVFAFQDAERDYFIEEYEEYLAENTQRVIVPGEIDSVSPHLRELFEECGRVLSPGSIALFFDFGVSDSNVTMPRAAHELPYYFYRGFGGGIDQMLFDPYETDITYQVDFDHAAWIAQKLSSQITVNYGPRHHLFREVAQTLPRSVGIVDLTRLSRWGYIQLNK